MWDLLNIWLSGLSILFGGLVIKLYFGLGKRLINRPARAQAEVWFAHGIMVAFVSTVSNVIYFKFLGATLFYLGIMNRMPASYSRVVNTINLIMLIWAAFCHLYSAYLNLSEAKRKEWTWVTIAFYPEYNPVVWLIHKVMRRSKDESDE